MADASGKPIGFLLTPGQAHDLKGADAFLPEITADAVLADRAFDADERFITPLEQAGKKVVVPSKKSRKTKRDLDQELYQRAPPD
jgi:transposase